MEKFDPSAAPVYPLPQRDPMRTLADWGAPPDPPIQPDAYERMAPPPWASRGERRSRSRPVPGWAVGLVMVGVLFLCVAGVVWAFFTEVGPPPGPLPTPAGNLTTSPAKL